MIAIVDDRIDDHFLVTRSLSAYPNIRFKSFYDGQQLIDYFEKHKNDRASLPDIVLLDVNMPTMSGYDTFKELKERHVSDNVYFAIFSNSNEYDFLRHQDLGIDSYSKPQAFDRLKEVLEKIIEKYLEQSKAK